MSSTITPNRRTHVRFDLAEATTSEPPQAHRRAGGEMARGGLDKNNSANVHRLATGAIALAPYQKTLSNQTEKQDQGLSILQLGSFTTIPGYVERNHYRGPEYLKGVTLDASTVSSGLPMNEKTVKAGESWAQTLAADVMVVPQPNYPIVTTVMDRHAVSNEQFDPNQSFTWRFRIPSGHDYTTSQICKHFGGPVNSNGNGQYSVVVLRNYMYLAEYSEQAKAATGNPWVQVDVWQWIAGDHRGEIATVHIHPYRSPVTGKLFIQFEGEVQANVGNSNSGQFYMQIHAAPQTITQHLFKVDTTPKSPSAPPPGLPARTQVTGQGPVRIEVARELRTPWQVSVWRYYPDGYVTDLPLWLPWHITGRVPVVFYWTADVPAGCAFVARLRDATTGVEMTATGRGGTGWKEYYINPGQPFYYASFDFFSDTEQKRTPVLYEYRVQRDAWIGSSEPGEFGAVSSNVSISGAEADPSHETASVLIKDFTGSLSRVRRRALIRTRIETEYDPADTDLRSVLFDGYIEKAAGRQKGNKGGRGASGANPKAYPSKDWRDFQISFVGMWARLHKSLTMFRLDLQTPDPNAEIDPETGVAPPFKVTDICRALLSYAGFTPGQIDVPDSPIRFFPSGAENAQTLMIDPLSNVAEAVTTFAKRYLGWYLIWDGNAGTQGGMWRLRPPVPNRGPFSPVATFTLDPQAPGKLATASESYNGDTDGRAWVGINPTIYIAGGTMEPYPIYPEGNAVCVTGTGEYLPENGQFVRTNWICNPKSYDFFANPDGSPIITSNPNSMDYMGFFAPIIVVNLGLGDQHTVDLVCRRIYDVSCHGSIILPFEAPLALIWDENDPLQSAPRPLRYYDTVTLIDEGEETTWLVRNCNPTYKKDGKQMAYYELQLPFEN